LIDSPGLRRVSSGGHENKSFDGIGGAPSTDNNVFFASLRYCLFDQLYGLRAIISGIRIKPTRRLRGRHREAIRRKPDDWCEPAPDDRLTDRTKSSQCGI
jgi:hypothetical protein